VDTTSASGLQEPHAIATQQEASTSHIVSTSEKYAESVKAGAVSSIPWLLTLGAGAAGLGVALSSAGGGSGGGGETPHDPGPPAPQNVLLGVIVAGPVIAGNQLLVKVFGATGQFLASASVDATGHYRVGIGDYSGPVGILVVNTAPGADYVSEVTRRPQDLSSHLMVAYNVTNSLTEQVVNINPVTTVAALHAGLLVASDGQAITTGVLLADVQVLAGRVDSSNTAVAVALGLGSSGDAVLRGEVITTVDSAGNANSQANAYGKWLAVLAGVEANHVRLTEVASAVGSGVLDTSVQSTLVDGAAAAGLPYTVIPGVVAPTVQSFTVLDTTTGNGAALGKLGETMRIVVTLSEAVSSTDGLTAHFVVNGQDVVASASQVTQSDTITFTATVPAGDGHAISLTSLGVNNGGLLRSDASHAAVSSPAAGDIHFEGYTVDNTAPLASVAVDVLNNAHYAVVQSSENGMAYLVNTAVTVRSLGDITGSADRLWNSVVVSTANADTHLMATGLSDGTYRVYTADTAGNLSVAAANTVVLDSTPPALTTSYSTAENTSADATLHAITLSGSDTHGPVVWSNLSGSDAASFTLSNGVLSFADVSNYETKPSYTVTVTGTDAAGNASTRALTISLSDVNEAPVAVGVIAAGNVVVGAAYSLDTSAYFSDPDTLASLVSGYHTLTYSLGAAPSRRA